MEPLSREFLLSRGYCCGNGCKNCPYNYCNVPKKKYIRNMEQSYQLANFLEDMDIDFEVYPDDDEGVFVEFAYLGEFYEVEFTKGGKVYSNGELTTYKEFISNVF